MKVAAVDSFDWASGFSHIAVVPSSERGEEGEGWLGLEYHGAGHHISVGGEQLSWRLGLGLSVC